MKDYYMIHSWVPGLQVRTTAQQVRTKHERTAHASSIDVLLSNLRLLPPRFLRVHTGTTDVINANVFECF